MSKRNLAYKAIPELNELISLPDTEDVFLVFDDSVQETKRVSSDKVKTNSTGWNDFLFSGIFIGKGAAPPDLETFRGGLKQNAFVGTGVLVEEGFFEIHILHDYKVGTKIYPHVHWSHKIGSPSGNVVWQIEYSVSKGHSGGVFPAPTTIELVQAAGVQYEHQIIETVEGDAIASTNLEADSVILGRIFRDPAHASDTFENDAFLLQIDFHYESDLIMTDEKERPFTKSQI